MKNLFFILVMAIIAVTSAPANAQSNKEKLKKLSDEYRQLWGKTKDLEAENAKLVEDASKDENFRKNREAHERNHKATIVENEELKGALVAKADTVVGLKEDLSKAKAEAEVAKKSVGKAKTIAEPLAKGEIRINYEAKTASYRKSEAESMKDRIPTDFEAREMPR